MSELKVGNKFEMKWPFYKDITSYTCLGNQFSGKHGKEVRESVCWVGGCFRSDESESEYKHEFFYNSTAYGKLVYEVLAIAEMPNRYQNRVIFKRSRIDPDGKLLSGGEVKVLTIGAFNKDINSSCPFKADFEIDNDFYVRHKL